MDLNFLNNFTRPTFKVVKTLYYSCLGFPNFLDNNLFTANSASVVASNFSLPTVDDMDGK